MQDYRKLDVWQKSHQLALDTYAVSAALQSAGGVADPRPDAPRGDLDSLEHCGRGRPRHRSRISGGFSAHSLGSCNELEYDLLLARDLEFLPAASHAQLVGQLEEVRRMLAGLIKSVTS